MTQIRLKLVIWEDGERTEKEVKGGSTLHTIRQLNVVCTIHSFPSGLEQVDGLSCDRWMLHAAESVQVTVENIATARISQQPKDLNEGRVGVGAAVWEGELLLATYMALAIPTHRLIGARVIELGAGMSSAAQSEVLSARNWIFKVVHWFCALFCTSGPGLAGLLLAKMGANVS
jgi:hypothetical protein